MRKILELLTKANDTLPNLDIVEQLDLYLELESLSNRLDANLLQFQLDNPEVKDAIKGIKQLAQEVEETGQGYEEYQQSLDRLREAIEAKRARLAEEQVKKDSIAKLVSLFKSLDLDKPLPEIYKKLSSEYSELQDLVSDLYMDIYDQEEEDLIRDMAAVEEQQRYYEARLYKTELS